MPAAPGSAFERLLAAPWSLPAVLALAAALRLLHLFAISHSPFADALQLDHRAYDEWGQRIAAGHLIGDGPFFVDPLYAYALGIVYALVGHSLLLVRLLQVGLGVATCWLTARIARRAHGDAALATLAALLMAIFIPAVHYESAIEKTALGVFLLALALDRYLADSPRAALAAGVALGLGVLARGTFLILVPAGALGLVDWRDWRASVPRVTLFVLGAAAMIGLATAHNLATGELVLTTANAGQNFYIGQQPENTLGVYTPPAFVRPDPRYEEGDFRAEAARRAGASLGASATSGFWFGQGLAAVGAAPGTAAERTLRKLYLFWHQYETPDNDNIELIADVSPVLHLPLLWMGLLAPLAALGAFVGWERRPVRVLVVTAGLYCLAVIGFFVLARFRAPLVPLLAVLAAGGIGWWRIAATAGEWGRAGVGAAAVAALALLLTTYPAWLDGVRRSSLAISYHNYGQARADAGDTDGAIAAYEKAVAIDAEAVPASLRALGDIYLARRQYDRAEAAMRRVLALRPDSRSAQDALARLEKARAGGAASAPAAAPAPAVTPGGPSVGELYKRVRQLRGEERWAEAIATLEEAIRIGPYNEDAHYLLGGLMEQHAPPDEMVRYWQAAVATDPKPQTAYYFWAVGLERGGDPDGAIAQLRAALEVDPAHEMSELRWAQILEKQGKLDEALAHCQTATTIFPDLKNAHETCARILRALGRTEEANAADERARTSDPNTPRRFVYWARYLQSKGRTAAAIAELERALRIDPKDAEARALLDQIRPAGDAAAAAAPLGAGLDAAARAALVSALKAQPAGTPVWLAVQDSDPGARELGAALRAAFFEAGWTLRGQRGVPFAMKPGVYLFAADAEPPPYVETVHSALDAAGLSPVYGSDYRSYYDERARANPNFGGFKLEPDQTYLIVIGRRPG